MSLQWFGIWGMADAPSPTENDESQNSMKLRTFLENKGYKDEKFKKFLKDLPDGEKTTALIKYWNKCKQAKENIEDIKAAAPPDIKDEIASVDSKEKREEQLDAMLEIVQESNLKEIVGTYMKQQLISKKK